MAAANAARSSSKSLTSSGKTSTKEKAALPKKDKGTKVLKVVEQFYRRFSKDTAGTFRFEAVDPKTKQPLKADDKNAHATQLYVRRGSSALSADPKFLKITIEEISALPKGAVVEDDSEDD